MKIKSPERKYFVMLLDKAAKTFDLKKPFQELERADVSGIQDAINFHVKHHQLLEKFPSTYAISGDRVLNTYRGHLKKETEEIPCNIKILNGVTHYATNGEITHWKSFINEKKKETLENQSNNLTSKKEKLPTDKKSIEPLSVIIELPKANFIKEDKKEEWMIYELAFLWFGKEPSSISAHFYQMTREMEALKTKLHIYVEQGLLKAKTISAAGGFTRFITRQDLEDFLKVHNQERPEFLKREERSNHL